MRLTVFAILVLFSVTQVLTGTVLPKPASISAPGAALTLDPKTFYFRPTGFTSDILTKALARYNALIFWGGNQSYQSPLAPVNLLEVNVLTNDQTLSITTDESYNLTVSTPTSTLRANSVFGALRGLETFSQLTDWSALSGYTVNTVTIIDSPRFQHRGTMIDTSRHFLPLSIIYQHLDAMAYSKFNVLHWHLVDDQSFPYQSTKFPNLSGKGAYAPNHVYSASDIQAVITYATQRGIRVIPEFDTPGHTQSWGNGYPEILTQCYKNNQPNGRYAFNPISNYTYDFITTFYTELAGVFPDDYTHVGGDEVSFSCWQSNPDIQKFMQQQGWTSYSLLEQYYEKNLLNIVAKTGKEYIIWEDVFDNGVVVRPDTVVDVWKGGWQTTIAKSTAAGYKSILSSPWYLNYISYGEDWPTYYKVEPLDFVGTNQQKKLVIGGETCFWAEFIDGTNIIPRAWPRACAIAERLWSPATVTDINDATTRMHDHRCRLLHRNIPAEPASGPSYCLYEFKSSYVPPWN